MQTLRESSATGRRTRILVSKVGQDVRDRGVSVVVSGIADLFFDVGVSALCHIPAEAVRDVLDADVSQAIAHHTLPRQYTLTELVRTRNL